MKVVVSRRVSLKAATARVGLMKVSTENRKHTFFSVRVLTQKTTKQSGHVFTQSSQPKTQT